MNSNRLVPVPPRNAVANRRRLPWLVALATLVPTPFCGCVALNIPSVRYHDPDDGGGWVGPLRKSSPSACLAEGEPGFPAPDAAICAGDWDLPEEPPPQPQVPWPRYHPVPTRPVFGGVLPAQP